MNFRVAKTKDFKDGLSFKNQFKNVEKLFENEIHGPESLLYHKGVLYTTLHGGQVVRIVNDKIIPFVKFGKQCGNYLFINLIFLAFPSLCLLYYRNILTN